jgi:hypothetical protein
LRSDSTDKRNDFGTSTKRIKGSTYATGFGSKPTMSAGTNG